MLNKTDKAAEVDAISELRQIVATLRGPDGCPWDREQTHASLRPHLIEEAHEVIEAIDNRDDAHFREELGDLLLQVVLHSQLAAEEERFTFDEVARGISEKLIRRHPHVFGEDKLATSEAVLVQWDQIKRQEKGNRHESLLDGVSLALPALMHAEKIQKRAARAGFDWPDARQVIEKIREETAEVETALEANDLEAIQDEIGDLLFTVVNFARSQKVDAELALSQSTRKFTNRFRQLEKIVRERGLDLAKMTLEEMDVIWNEVKAGKPPGDGDST